MTLDHRVHSEGAGPGGGTASQHAPGKHTRVESLGASSISAPGKQTLTQQIVQHKAAAGGVAPQAGAAPGDGDGGGGGGGSGGKPLPPDVKRKMEQAFGADFSAVRIHDGQSDMPGAQAYTKGTDIYFAPGQYDPHSPAGQTLLGHELSHVVQQSQGRVKATTQSKGVAINNDAGLEHEADVHGAAAARGERVSGGAAGAVTGGGAPAAQCFVPGDDVARAAVTAAFDTLLGNGNDPGGLRAAATGHAADLPALQAAVTAIATTAAVPLGDRAPLIALLGNNLTLTAQLLAAATAPSGAGTPAVRLNRVLAANPLTPRTVHDLQPLLGAQHAIDDKIVRGRTGTALGADEQPTADHRTLIGGHAPGVAHDPSNVVESTVHNANGTDYVGFRKLIRSDAGASATDVQNATADDPVGGCLAAGGTANLAAAAAAAPVNQVPAALQLANPVAFGKATAAFNAKHAKFVADQLAAATAHGQLQAHAVTVRGVAAAAAAAPTNGAAVKPFIDAMADLLASMNALVVATTTVDPAAGATALARFNAIKTRFETRGPVLSVKKNSTLAPAAMSDDDVLRAGDQAAATPATLIRHDATLNNPADGALVDTKHQLLLHNVVWVAMTSNVTFHTGHPPTLTGGTVISSYPTSMTAVPADTIHPARDPDRFSTIP